MTKHKKTPQKNGLLRLLLEHESDNIFMRRFIASAQSDSVDGATREEVHASAIAQAARRYEELSDALNFSKDDQRDLLRKLEIALNEIYTDAAAKNYIDLHNDD